jgi:hypothetical protein
VAPDRSIVRALAPEEYPEDPGIPDDLEAEEGDAPAG